MAHWAFFPLSWSNFSSSSLYPIPFFWSISIIYLLTWGSYCDVSSCTTPHQWSKLDIIWKYIIVLLKAFYEKISCGISIFVFYDCSSCSVWLKLSLLISFTNFFYFGWFAGLSLKSQELTAIFLAVRLYCSFVMEYDIHTLLDTATLVFTIWVIYMIRFKLRSTYMEDKDNFALYYVVSEITLICYDLVQA